MIPRILVIGIDASVADSSSPASVRQRSYFAGWNACILVLATGDARQVTLDESVQVIVTGGATKAHAFLRGIRFVREHIRTSRPSIISAQDPFWCGWLAWWFSSTKTKLYIQDHSAFGSRTDRSLASLLARAIGGWLLRRADRVRTVSERGCRGLVEIRVDPKRIDVISIATNKEPYHSIAPISVVRGHVLCVARLEPEKDVQLLLRAWRNIVQKDPHVQLHIVGDGSLRHVLERLVCEYGLESSVVFLGKGAPDVVLSEFAWADVVVQPSVFEGWGMAVVEAALSGRPIVMTDVGCAGEIIRDGHEGRVISIHDERVLAEAILDLLHSPEQIKMFGQHARERALQLPDPAETCIRVRGSILRVLEQKPCALICAQAMDEADPLFGFFVPWVRAFAKKSDTIICALRVSDPAPDCGEGVRIVPLRSRGSRSKWRAFITLLRTSWCERYAYSSVFVRGDAQYVVLCAWLWRLLGKRIVFWYAHYTSSGIWFFLASHFAHEVVTSVSSACAFPGAVCIGQGVDETRFITKVQRDMVQPYSIMIFGRISPVKRVPWILDQLFQYHVVCPISVYGKATHEHEATVVAESAKRCGAIWVQEDVRYERAPTLYLQHRIFVNATPGSLDKTIVEAMLSGSVVIASSHGYAECLPQDLAWLSPSDDAFGETVLRATRLTSEECRAIGDRLSVIALQRHSQTHQIERLIERLRLQ